MKEDGEIEEGLPSGEEEPQPEPPYDPLIEPWNDPASTSIFEYRLSQVQERPALRAAAPDRPYPRFDELSDLRRRLREGTVVVPRRRRGGRR